MGLMKQAGRVLNRILLMRTNKQSKLSVEQAPSSPRVEDTKPLTFFKVIYRTFQRAEQNAGGPIERFYVIGGYTIRLRFAGSALIPFITPALEHLAAKPAMVPALTVCLWDSASTDTKMPPPPWKIDDYVARGEIWGFNNERFNTVFQTDVSILNMLDSEQNLAIYWIRDFRHLRYYETASPLRTFLYWWMRKHDRQMVHAAAIGNSNAGVLIPGKGGSGKSTTSLACLHSGLFYVGDNYVLLSQESTPFAYSLYNSCTLQAANIRHRFPYLMTKISNPEKLDVEKALLFVHQHYHEFVTKRIPIKVILLPEVTSQHTTRVRRVSPAKTLISLAPSSLFYLPNAGQDDFQRMACLVKQVPSYVLELGADISKIPDVILELLSKQ